MRKFLVFVLLQAFFINGYANIQLPKIFSNNMVLQRDQPIPVWGWGDPREKVTVTWNNISKSTTTGKDGKWKVTFDPQAHGGPFELIVKGKNEIVLKNILVGDVWICSGQSNMEWPLISTENAESAISQANFPTIRHFKVPIKIASVAQDDVTGGEWKICTPENVKDFTAVGYFFAREIVKDQNIPIGLLNTTWGGTHVETWTSREAFENSEEFKSMIASMPRLNLDSLTKQKNASMLKKIETLQGKLVNSPSEVVSWKDRSTDDNSWPVMNIPTLWESQALGEFDGVVWFRKTINLTSSQITSGVTLELAQIDDVDETYINGTKVGATAKYNDKRKYNILDGLLQPGDNVIAVRVNDTGGGGGIYGNEPLRLTTANAVIDLRGPWKYRVESVLSGSSSIGPNAYPTLLFNAMISPLLPLRIKGALWYQGEANASRSYQYRKAFPLMIADWRKNWKQGAFPFYFVQLATFNAGNGTSENGSGWAELREAQTMTLSLPNTGMAVTTDIGDVNDIHPRNKLDVGKRLAALALARTYNRGTVDSGPMYKRMEVTGNAIVITFEGTGAGLMAKDKYGYLRGFEIAGKDQKFQYAKAYITEDNKVVVSHESINEPSAVRFGWADDASDCNLFNKERFPAVPFRTDQFKGITEGSTFTIEK